MLKLGRLLDFKDWGRLHRSPQTILAMAVYTAVLLAALAIRGASSTAGCQESGRRVEASRAHL